MAVDNHALFTSVAMSKRRVSSHQSPGSQAVAKMKARQSAKIREIGEALVAAGFVTLDAKTKALGLSRSTTWTIVKASHKSTGLSAKIIDRILAVRELPPLVRARILEYVEEKAIGCYGHTERLRRKFITLLLAKRVEQTDLEEIFRLPAEARILKIASALGPASQNISSVTSASYPRPLARSSRRASIDRKLQRSRGAL